MASDSGTRLVLVGAGGHAREVLDLLDQCNETGITSHQVVGLLADTEPDQAVLARHRVAWLGPVEPGLRAAPPDLQYLIGIGDGAIRLRVCALADAVGLTAPVLVHPTAVIGSHTALGPGTLLFAHTSVTTNVSLGRHVHLNRGSTVGHDSVLEDCVTLHPRATVSGNCHVAAASTMGTGSTVIQGRRIGAGSMVGAGAAVVHDVARGSTVVGVPARPIQDRSL